jgi:arabinoxylan arabinofuranohydrolase
MSHKAVGVLLGLCFTTPAFAQNPIVPPGVYIADPTARVWKDGRVWVYGSRDESPRYYCSTRYDILSSADLKTWTLHPDGFVSKGAGDGVPYSDAVLYAPDAAYKGGKYFLYYPLATFGRDTEGVAVSDSPAGPFRDGRVIELGGRNEIDPAVFVDDDGQAYYLWGQFSAKIARLKPDMTEIDLATVKDGVVTEKEHFFHEGAFLTKREGLYYLVYAHMGRAGRPTSIGYATSHSPLGPYAYGGVIVDNDHSDPAVWNNHGSIAEVGGRWYVFYHRSTHASDTMRKACVEPITFTADGRIPEVEMTTQGAAPPLPAQAELDAARACLLYGNVRIEAAGADNEVLAGVRNGDAAAYKYLDFGAGVARLRMRVAPGAKPTHVDVVIDNSWGPALAALDVPGGGDGRTFTSLTVPVHAPRSLWAPVSVETQDADARQNEGPRGVHAVWLRFRGEGQDLARVDSFRFE